jgi:hypothetical protein
VRLYALSPALHRVSGIPLAQCPAKNGAGNGNQEERHDRDRGTHDMGDLPGRRELVRGGAVRRPGGGSQADPAVKEPPRYPHGGGRLSMELIYFAILFPVVLLAGVLAANHWRQTP